MQFNCFALKKSHKFFVRKGSYDPFTVLFCVYSLVTYVFMCDIILLQTYSELQRKLNYFESILTVHVSRNGSTEADLVCKFQKDKHL